MTPGNPAASPMSSLKRFLHRREGPPIRAEEVCDLCAAPIGRDHPHLVSMESRRLMCACRACALLFVHEGAAGGRYRVVPDRYLFDPSFVLPEALWDRLGIPVRMAFFFKNSSLDRIVAFYPSPAGATQSVLGLDAWDEIASRSPLVDMLVPDVEALLVHGTGPHDMACVLVPIPACYELVGLVRTHWKGFHGGEEAWTAIRSFFDRIRERSRPLKPPGPR